MPSDAAELTTLVTALDELTARVGAITQHYEGTTRDDLLGALFEAERSLRAATRSVELAARLAG